ncbi:MAG: glucose/sorbosone dehydrogenase [Ramlibacter sp.]|nr:glucose/sorbosone dehydrogenase [Ramlibacter sp.]
MRNGMMFAIAALALSASVAVAADPKEADYYKILTFEPPKGLVLEAGALEWMPDGKLAVATRRGDIYLVENPYANDPAKDSKFVPFATGLHEVLGLAYRDGWLYVSQRGELSRIKDGDGDGKADVFETVSDAWGITGDYHE